MQSAMGGGTMRVDPLVPQIKSAPNKLSSPSPSSSSSSSSPNLNIKHPLSTADDSMLLSPVYGGLSCCDCNCHSQPCRKLKPVDLKNEAKSENTCVYDRVFEPVPSQQEVEDAISALQNFIQVVSSSSTQQQISSSYDSRIFLSEGYRRLYDAIQLLQADPSIKRLVASLSSDKAIWDAVMSNVRLPKLLEMPDSVECRMPQISEQNEFGMYILTWILDIIKGKISELIESFQSLINDLFQSPKMENDTVDATVLHEKLKSSLLLCIVILLIVIMARSKRL